MAYTLYRFWDRRGSLLYVGMTENLAQRTAQHRTKTWWPEVASTTTEIYPTRGALRHAEAEAIAKEIPLHNVRGKRLADGSLAEPAYGNSKTGIRGVHFEVGSQRFRVTFRIDGVDQFGGYHATLKEAVEAKSNLLKRLHARD